MVCVVRFYPPSSSRSLSLIPDLCPWFQSHERVLRNRLETKLTRAISSEKLDLTESLETLQSVARGREAMLKYCHASPTMAKLNQSPTSALSITEEEDVPTFFLDGDDEEDEQEFQMFQPSLPPAHHSDRGAVIIGTVYNRTTRKTNNSSNIVFYGVDSAVFGAEKNTEPAFPTLPHLMKHIAASR